MLRFSTTLLATLLAVSFAGAQSADDKSVLRLDPALDALVSPDANVELIKGGFGFTEGPVCPKREDRLSPLHRYSRQRDLQAHAGWRRLGLSL